MKNNKLLYILGGAVVLLIILAVVGKKAGWFGNGDIDQVAVEKVEKRTITESVTASGKINPVTEVKLSSEVSGEVIELNVQEGDSVKKGELLCVINPAIYESMVTQAEAGVNQVKSSKSSGAANMVQLKAAMDQAKRNFDRNKELHDQKVISDLEFEGARLQYEQAQSSFESAQKQLEGSDYGVRSAEAQLRQTRESLQKTKLFAPMDGIVSLVAVKLGERVVGTAQMAGTELIRIADLNDMQAEVDVNENDVLRISLGDTADIEVDAYVKRKFKGVVTQVGYSSTNALQQLVNTSTATNFTVKVKLLKESYAELVRPEIGHPFPFRPGMSCTVDVKTESRPGILTVPIPSVTTREEKDLQADVEEGDKKKKSEPAKADNTKTERKEIVFVVEGGKAIAKTVKTGIQDANYIEILEGLKEGETVVKAPFKLISKTLKNGKMVKVVDESELFTDTKGEEE